MLAARLAWAITVPLVAIVLEVAGMAPLAVKGRAPPPPLAIPLKQSAGLMGAMLGFELICMLLSWCTLAVC